MGNVESTQPADASEKPTGVGVGAAETAAATAAASTDDEPWWNEIEHENLILEQLPIAQVSLKVGQSNSAEKASARFEEQRQEQSMEEFKEQLASKRLARQTAMQDMREEIASLRKQLLTEQAANKRLRMEQGQELGQDQGVEEQEDCAESEQPEQQKQQDEEVDTDDENPISRSRHANIELANAQLALQLANAENLSLRGELDVVQRQVGTLKEVICCCKQMLNVKEEQCAQLKMKLQEIENSFSEREMKIMSNNLRQEYERQLVNIRQLRQLYEERQRVAAAEYENLQRLISIKKDELTAEQEKTKSFEERHQLLLKELESANAELAKLREECGEHKYEKRALKDQVGAVNLLFSQLVMGFNGEHNLDIDRLTQMLEENRDLLNEMTQAEGSCSEGATLPKLLFELVEQAAKSGEPECQKSRSATPTPTAEPSVEYPVEVRAMASGEDATDSVKPEPGGRRHRGREGVNAAASLKSHEPEIMGKVASAQEIIGNLPKVWKVLMELLSHHKIERVQFEELPAAADDSHRTAAATTTTATAGKAPELSVSKTYIKLKDLIMEKKSLVKETNRLKTLNCHLDYRLNEQEKRLSAVSLELTKTWHMVGKMQRQHRQLHTQEQILRYQLQQKRRLLNELKDELEYCRRKWAAARAKNDESQEQCNDWRREFARRKLEDANHSAESGYSDSSPQSDEDSAAGKAALVRDNTATPGEPSPAAHCRRKHLRDQFEHTRKIKRMQSTSPGRQSAAAAAAAEEDGEEIVLRWNSAPPTCGWREGSDYELDDEPDDEVAAARGAVPKTLHSSRGRQRGKDVAASCPVPADAGTASRIQKLEEQCKSLIQQVLETSGNRERLEVQLCRFQDEISPAQHAVPLDEFINRKRLERMTRASSAPATGTLTPREEEYTRKRSERLGRLEEESRQLLSRIKRTADRGHYLKKSLDRLRRAPSREGSFESNTEEEPKAQAVQNALPEAVSLPTHSPLTAEEEEYTARRAARLQRLEQESQQLLSQLSHNTQRGERLGNKLDTLHEQAQRAGPASTMASISQTVEQRLEDIERVSASRAERLRRMEEQGNELIARLSNTSERGTAMINRIAEREASRRQEAELIEQTAPAEEAACSLGHNLASSCIVAEGEEQPNEAAHCVLVTTTASQLATQQPTGAIPKTTSRNQTQGQTMSKPLAHLCAARRHEDAAKKRILSTEAPEQEQPTNVPESLEDMVLRLRALPYPATVNRHEEQRERSEEPEERQESDGN